jgi:CcmD family protein
MTGLPIGAPALPLDEAGRYVAAAYVVFLVLILVYVAIMAAKLQRIERELRELAGFAETRSEEEKDTSEAASISDEPRPSEVAR